MFVLIIRIYQKLVAPILPTNTCRFYPTCSSYAIDALTRHGTWKGIFLSLKRLLRCHPYHPGGYDPVP